MLRVCRMYRPHALQHAVTIPFTYLEATTYRTDFTAFQTAVNGWWDRHADPNTTGINFNLNKHGLEIVVRYRSDGPIVTWFFVPSDLLITKIVQLHVDATPLRTVNVVIPRSVLSVPAPVKEPQLDIMALLCGMDMGVDVSSLEITVNKDFLILTAEPLR
jgi:hypothetical protein